MSKPSLHTTAVHAGDRKAPTSAIPSTVPIYAASSYLYGNMAELDRTLEDDAAGPSYQRYGNPTAQALEAQVTALESGFGTLATATGMLAIQFAIEAALMDRRRSIVAANALYGATLRMLMSVFEPAGVEVRFVDICDLDAVATAIAEAKPGCVLLESISNPLLRVGQVDRIAELARAANAALIVDNTFATPLLLRPLEHGAHMVVHSLTKFLSGHGDTMGGAIVSDEQHFPALRSLARTCGPQLGPFECYLAMRGIKTFPLRMERQCANAAEVARFLSGHGRVARVYFPGEASHPDAEAIARLFPANLYGALVAFDLKDAGREQVFAFMERLRLVVRGTSLGDVHSLMLYPAMASHRDISPKQRARLGIGDGLVRLSVGIESAADIIDDLQQALG